MITDPICFVDIETTGTSAYRNRIIEIGIIKTQNDKIIKTYNTLINPEVRIDPFIENLTGIDSNLLENAPVFENIKDEIFEMLSDSYFVAHNVRFDYGFLRNEFKRCNIRFSLKHFCTVKLSRLLYPSERAHNLDAIIDRFGIKCANRHRALDDTRVIYDFYKLAKKIHTKEIFEKALNTALNRPSIPLNIDQSALDTLPESPGVYTFFGEKDEILYIGKSINIRDRVLSHFSNDHLNATDMKIAREIKRIETNITNGELEALLLESTMIKNHQPLFNRRLRRARKMIILTKYTDELGYHTVLPEEINNINVENLDQIVGVFRNQKQYKDFLYEIAKNYNLCPKLLNVEKSKTSCFSYQLGNCKGACIAKETTLKYNLRFDEAFYKYKIKRWKFEGPIILRESLHSQEGFLIDKWCLLGKIKRDSDIYDLKREYHFDLDTYKILYRYIYNKAKSYNIQNFQTSN